MKRSQYRAELFCKLSLQQLGGCADGFNGTMLDSPGQWRDLQQQQF